MIIFLTTYEKERLLVNTDNICTIYEENRLVKITFNNGLTFTVSEVWSEVLELIRKAVNHNKDESLKELEEVERVLDSANIPDFPPSNGDPVQRYTLSERVEVALDLLSPDTVVVDAKDLKKSCTDTLIDEIEVILNDWEVTKESKEGVPYDKLYALHQRVDIAARSYNRCRSLDEYIKQLHTQLEVCELAVEGQDNNIVFEGDYAWTPVYGEICKLRKEYDKLVKDNERKEG